MTVRQATRVSLARLAAQALKGSKVSLDQPVRTEPPVRPDLSRSGYTV